MSAVDALIERGRIAHLSPSTLSPIIATKPLHTSRSSCSGISIIFIAFALTNNNIAMMSWARRKKRGASVVLSTHLFLS